jgi:hypothetical protein
MNTREHDVTHPSRARAGGLKPAAESHSRSADRQDGAMRGATLTLVVALYPLVGSVTVVIAALLLAGGALAG